MSLRYSLDLVLLYARDGSSKFETPPFAGFRAAHSRGETCGYRICSSRRLRSSACAVARARRRPCLACSEHGEQRPGEVLVLPGLQVLLDLGEELPEVCADITPR